MGETISNQEELSAKLSEIYRNLLITTGFACIGWPVFAYGFNVSGILMMMLGSAIIAAPILYSIYKSGSMGTLLFWKEPEIVRVDKQGRRISDDGSQFMGSLLSRALVGIMLLIIGCLVTLGKIIFLITKYFTVYSQLEQKPTLAKSAIPVVVVGLIVFVASLSITQAIAIKEMEAYYTSDMNGNEIRAIVKDVKAKILASSYDYTYTELPKEEVTGGIHPTPDFQVKVKYNSSKDTIRVDVYPSDAKKYRERYDAGELKIAPGYYTYKGGNFVEYKDTTYNNYTERASDIEAVKAYFPGPLFLDRFINAKDDELFAKKPDENMSMYKVVYLEGSKSDQRMTLHLKKDGESYRLHDILPNFRLIPIKFSYL